MQPNNYKTKTTTRFPFMFGDRAVLFTRLPKNLTCMAGKRYEKSKQTVTILGSEQEIIDYMIFPRKMKKGS